MATRRQSRPKQGSKPRQGVYYNKKKRKKKRSKAMRFFRVLQKLLLLALLAVIMFFSYKYTRMEKEKLHRGDLKAGSNLSERERAKMEGYRTLPVILVDADNEHVEDILLIASIEQANGNLRIAAIDTDTFLDASDGYGNDCKNVYEVDGAKRLVSLLNDNLNLDMEDYLVLRTCIIKEMVDRQNGLHLTLSDKEKNEINDLLHISGKLGIGETEKAEEEDEEDEDGQEQTFRKEEIPVEPETEEGEPALNGDQVMTYIRNPRSKKSEMERLAEVAGMLLHNVEDGGLITANHESDELLYHVSTTLSTLDYLALLAEMKVYEIKPYAEMPKDIPDHPETLHEYLYPPLTTIKK